MKETAVQMLISRLPNIDWNDHYYSDIMKEAIHQEKEQIIDAAKWGYLHCPPEQYYNETYKSRE